VKIGEFVQVSGLPRSTIRFYERVGLLSPEQSASGNGYRHYDATHLERARMVRMGQKLGFSLREIIALMQAWDGNRLTEAQKCAVMREKIGQISARMAELEEMRQYLCAKLERVERGEAA
jgi:MerR family transcriptional regulator, copper efflux regulator